MKKIVFFLILSVVYVFAGCGENKTGDTGQVVLDISIQNEQGSSITQALTRAPAPADITMVTVSVTGLVEPVAVDIDSLESSFEVPAGKDREFVTRAFNSTNELIYHGAVKADIIAGEETRVAVILVSVSEPIETSMNPAAVTIQPVFTGATTPANITSYSIRVTSPLSTLITSQAYTPGSAIQIPSGNTRLIEITAYSPTGDYSGTVTRDFAAGEVATVQVNMSMQYTAVTINLTDDPPNATSYTVTVTTSGETALTTQDFTPGTSFQVPAGSSKQFDIIAYSPTGDYSGTVTQDLTAGESVTITVTMQYADVTINPVLPLGTPTASLSYIVTVTTSGSAAFTRTFASGTAFRVPAGDAMDFEILVSTPSVTFRATSTQNLAANSSVTISPDMVLYETKIIIPDYLNGRLVQIDDVSNNGWVSKVNTDIGFSPIFNPYDIDFDSQGRIYIANNGASTGEDVIIRIDNINGGNLISFGSNGSGYVAVAVDRTNNILYRASSSLLYRSDLDGNPLATLDSTGLLSIRGLAYDNGLLYIAYSNSFSVYNPATQSIVDTLVYSSTGYEAAWGVTIKSSIIYGTIYDYNTPSNNKVIQFSFDSGTSTLTETNTYSTSLYGPHRFMNQLSAKLIFNDEDATLDRIISMNDISGAGRLNYGENGTPATDPGVFDFFE